MTLELANEEGPGAASETAPVEAASARRIGETVRSIGFALLGVGVLLLVWWIDGWIVAHNPATSNFVGFAPAPTFKRL